MGAMQLVTAQSTAIGATLAAQAAATGDSLAVSNFDLSKKAYLIQAWVTPQAAGTVRIRSPRFHDNVNGIRYRTTASDQKPFMPWRCVQRLYPNDVLIVELAGSAVAGDIEYTTMIQVFDDLPGIAGRFMTPDQLLNRIEHIITVENTIATPTSGGYAAAQAINATIDQFQNGIDYALLGYKCDTKTHAIGYRAPDFGNVRVGGPGDPSDFDLYSDWFVRLSAAYGIPLIPVFNGQNKASIFIDAVQDENGADPVVTTWLAKLKAA